MVQRSPDGQWQWDGTQWRPAQPVPLPTPPNRRRRKAPWIIAGCVVVAAAVAVPVALVAGHKDKDSAPKPALVLGQPVTQAALDKASPADLYWQVLQQQMTRPMATISASSFPTPAAFKAHTDYSISRLTIDRGTGKFTYGSDAYARGEIYARGRCVGAKSYAYNDFDRKWGRLPEQDEDCQRVHAPADFASDDGVAATGLSVQQAAKVIKALRVDYKGLVNPGKPTLLHVHGKSYIRQTVDFVPQKLSDGEYWGAQILTFAFKRSGLDPNTWYWTSLPGGGEGLHVVYYLDPAELVPVASVQRTTPVLGDDGKPRSGGQAVLVFNYAYPAKLPKATFSGPPYTLVLPEGWALR